MTQRILIADQEHEHRPYLTDALREHGHAILEAVNAAEALRYAKYVNHLDLVVLGERFSDATRTELADAFKARFGDGLDILYSPLSWQNDSLSLRRQVINLAQTSLGHRTAASSASITAQP
jgi:CheY-like chemotaxis protein